MFGTWLTKLVDSVFAWVPRLVHIRRTHKAVVFTGSRAKAWEPGLHLLLPLVSSYEEFPVVRQTHNMSTQVVLTTEGQALAVSGILVYTIVDIMLALSASYEVEETIADISRTALVEVVAGEPLVELGAKLKDGRLAHELTIRTRRRLRPFGVKVSRVGITDFATCSVVRHLGAPLPGYGELGDNRSTEPRTD